MRTRLDTTELRMCLYTIYSTRQNLNKAWLQWRFLCIEKKTDVYSCPNDRCGYTTLCATCTISVLAIGVLYLFLRLFLLALKVWPLKWFGYFFVTIVIKLRMNKLITCYPACNIVLHSGICLKHIPLVQKKCPFHTRVRFIFFQCLIWNEVICSNYWWPLYWWPFHGISLLLNQFLYRFFTFKIVAFLKW